MVELDYFFLKDQEYMLRHQHPNPEFELTGLNVICKKSGGGGMPSLPNPFGGLVDGIKKGMDDMDDFAAEVREPHIKSSVVHREMFVIEAEQM